MKKAVALILCFLMLAAFAGCGTVQGGKAEVKVQDTADFESFLFNGMKKDFEAFLQTEDGKDCAVTSMDSIVGSMTFVQIVFDFMKTGKVADGYEITEASGVYKLKINQSVMTYKFDVESCSIYYKVEDEAGLGMNFWSVVTQRNNTYYAQRYVGEYQLLNEISFTAEGGSWTAVNGVNEPTPIYAADIPSGFAKPE